MNDIKKLLNQHKLTNEDYKNIKNILKREPNLVEIGIFSAMWSEHCSYKSSKKYLNNFPTKAPWVIQGPGENAGVIDVGDGVVAVFKMESHNHPSFIEPYQGAATGVGGILRDVFTMGARPVANFNSLYFGDVSKDDENSKHQRYLVRGCVKGIGDYGNCMGVPTIGGNVFFDECYNENILVNAFSLGLCKKEDVFYAKAEGVGNVVIYVGSKTGRDGLGGAVMASDSFNEENKSLRPTVQVGDAFSEKLLLEACMELFKHDYIVGIQDMGAAGLTSSSFEMAGKTGAGLKIKLDKVPQREENMNAYELMLSESQERMLICAKKGHEKDVIDIFKKWQLDAEVIGEVTNTGNMELFWHQEQVANIPIAPLSECSPVLDREVKKPKYLDNLEYNINENVSNHDAFLQLFSTLEIAQKSWVYNQYDSSVQSNTIKAPGSLDASVIWIKQNDKALAIASDCNPRYNYINPQGGAAAAVMQSGRNVAMSGATPLAITDCLNYGNPQNPEVMWQIAAGCEGIKQACKELNTPVVSGNVSLYNETNSQSIFPTPSIVMVGLNDDKNKVLKSVFQHKNSSIYVIGEDFSEFGGSLYMKTIDKKVAGILPKIDYEKELLLWDFIIKANKKSLLHCAKDISSGGLAIALAKMSAISGFGGDFEYTNKNTKDIFSESFSRAIVEIKDEKEFLNFAKDYNLKITKIGQTNDKNFKLNDIDISINELKDIYLNTFQKVIQQDI